LRARFGLVLVSKSPTLNGRHALYCAKRASFRAHHESMAEDTLSALEM